MFAAQVPVPLISYIGVLRKMGLTKKSFSPFLLKRVTSTQREIQFWKPSKIFLLINCWFSNFWSKKSPPISLPSPCLPKLQASERKGLVPNWGRVLVSLKYCSKNCLRPLFSRKTKKFAPLTVDTPPGQSHPRPQFHIYLFSRFDISRSKYDPGPT